MVDIFFLGQDIKFIFFQRYRELQFCIFRYYKYFVYVFYESFFTMFINFFDYELFINFVSCKYDFRYFNFYRLKYYYYLGICEVLKGKSQFLRYLNSF